MIDKIFSDADCKQIKNERLMPDQVLDQIRLFKKGMIPVKLNRPCTIGDGIITIKKKEIAALLTGYEQALQELRVLKFVPASGAASRMFKGWYNVLETGNFDNVKSKTAFFRNMKHYAFFQDLYSAMSKEGENLLELINKKNVEKIITYILTEKGLNYGNLPKALLKFHAYPEGARTALEEQMVEAVLYVTNRHHFCHVHFTVSEEHKKDTESYLSKVKTIYEKHYGININVEMSVQLSSTKTIAVDMANLPFRNSRGKLVFRPGGHGALLENLDRINGDIIFIKNIDNVVPDRLKQPTILYKKILGGYLIALQSELHHYLRLLSREQIVETDVGKIKFFCEKKLCVVFPSGFEAMSLKEKCRFLIMKLNRPIRVCGVVKNEGEPGGVPFWVDENDGTQSLQIVELFQIDEKSNEQHAIWSSATHFNPVDLVCSIRNFQGKKFDLHEYVNPETICISQKSEKGRELKVLEWPGLWNGSMALWNTVFVEVPIETFNPVKTVYDLLRPQHRTYA
jgi:hypothetical protein